MALDRTDVDRAFSPEGPRRPRLLLVQIDKDVGILHGVGFAFGDASYPSCEHGGVDEAEYVAGVEFSSFVFAEEDGVVDERAVSGGVFDVDFHFAVGGRVVVVWRRLSLE
jgi:hypothetical protein